MKVKKIITIFVPVFVFNFMNTLLFADVTLEKFTKISGFAGAGENESTIVSKISGLKKREKVNIKFTGSMGKLISKFGGPMETDSITDINRDVIWILDHTKKTFIEKKISFEKEKIMKHEENKPEVKIIRNEFSVKDTGEKKIINGYNCKKYILNWLVETEDLETKERAKSIMTGELWNTDFTKELKILQKEETEFNQAYLKKAGLEMSPQEAQRFGLEMVAGFMGTDAKVTDEQMKKLTEELSRIKGYTIASYIKWKYESESMKKQRMEAEKKEEIEESEEEESDDIDVSHGVSGFLGGMAKKVVKEKAKEEKKKKEAEEKVKQSEKENVVFESYSEIKKISTSRIDASEFSVPAGYKLVK